MLLTHFATATTVVSSCQFHQHVYGQLLRKKIQKVLKFSQVVSIFFALSGFARLKAVSKLFVKLRADIFCMLRKKNKYFFDNFACHQTFRDSTCYTIVFINFTFSLQKLWYLCCVNSLTFHYVIIITDGNCNSLVNVTLITITQLPIYQFSSCI